jgi:basic membrane protein A and related proteins
LASIKREKEAHVKKALALLLVVLVGISLVGLADGGKVGVVLDVGGRGDLSFNDMAFKGTDQAVAEFDWEMTTLQSSTAADYLPNIRNLARTGEYDLIICVGFLLGDALAAAAEEFPEQKFAIIDVGYITGPNIMNIVFLENEASALIGALAAMAAAEYGYSHAGLVLGMEIPVLYHFEAGFRFGMDWANQRTGSDIGMLYTYTGSFNDVALGKPPAEAMLAQGAVGVYGVAGGVGIGSLEAITEAHQNAGTLFGPPYYFGVDANQDYLGDGMHVLASGMKRVDIAAYTAVKAVAEGTFESGVTSLGIVEGGGSISKLDDLAGFIEYGIEGGAVDPDDFYMIIANWARNRASIPSYIWEAVAELEAGIIDGSIVVPTAENSDEMGAVRQQYTLGAP